jgi:hypothetical protein
MGCVKRCLEYLGQDVSLPWLFGGTTNAFVPNMNNTVFVDAALAWASETLFTRFTRCTQAGPATRWIGNPPLPARAEQR